MWAAGGLVVDIRPVELRERDGEMPGALVVGRNVLEWRLDPTSPHRLPDVTGPDQPVVLVCDEGYASSLAAATLRELGLRRATDLDGGYQAWLRANAGSGKRRRFCQRSRAIEPLTSDRTGTSVARRCTREPAAPLRRRRVGAPAPRPVRAMAGGACRARRPGGAGRERGRHRGDRCARR